MKNQVNKNKAGYKILSFLLGIAFKIYYNPKIVNKENIPSEGPIIIASNHKHVYDQCLSIIATKRFVHYMAKKEYFEGKLAWFFKLVGCIPVDRGNSEDTSKEIALEILKEKGAIGIFPEGTRNKTYDTLLLPFKYGTVSMSKKTNAWIVPCVVTGDYCFRSKNLMIRFGTPFQVGEKEYDEANKILKNDMERLIEENLKATNRTLEEELASRNQDQKKA